MNFEDILKKYVDEEGKFDYEAAAKELKEEQAKAYVPKDDFNTKNTELKDANVKIQTLESEKQGLENLQSEVEKYKKENLKLSIGTQAGLSAEWIDRLRGETEEELKADAEKLSDSVNKKQIPPLRPTEPNANDKDAGLKQMLQNMKDSK